MKILYKEDFISVKKFSEVETPNFVVLTGVNGSGKTHLLKAIAEKKVIIEGLDNGNVVYFNYLNFFIENENELTSAQIDSEKNAAWELYNQRFSSSLLQYKTNFLENDGTYSHALEVSEQTGLPLWELSENDGLNPTELLHFAQYKRDVDTLLLKHREFQNNPQAQAIFVLITRLHKTLDELPFEEFLDLYKPISLKGEFLPTQLGKGFWDYQMKYKKNQIRIFQNEKEGRSDKTLTDEEFIKVHGEKPWEVARAILDRFDSMNFTFNTPEGMDYFGRFKLMLKDKTTNQEVTFQDLSSGEQVLMALIASIYKLNSDQHFPDILLLDEIDASLHPSMIKNMLSVINDVFVKRGTKVILVTHSPTTVAISSDESIFVVNKNGSEKITKSTKSNALSLLTEGYATLDEGLRLLDQTAKTKLSIFTEGRNVEYLKRAVKLLLPEKEDSIEIVEEIKDISGKNELKTYCRFFMKMHHSNRVLFVWDCDAVKEIVFKEENGTYPFVFSTNEANKKVTTGVENLFAEALFTSDFYSTSIKNDGGLLTQLDKKKFEKFVVENCTADDFKNFKPFIAKVKELVT